MLFRSHLFIKGHSTYQQSQNQVTAPNERRYLPKLLFLVRMERVLRRALIERAPGGQRFHAPTPPERLYGFSIILTRLFTHRRKVLSASGID